MPHQSALPFFIPRCNIIFLHKLSQRPQRRYRRPALNQAIIYISKFMTSSCIKPYFRLPERAHDTALFGNNAARTYRKLRFIPIPHIASRISTLAIYTFHCNYLRYFRLFYSGNAHELITQLFFLDCKLLLIRNAAQKTSAAAPKILTVRLHPML